MTQIDAVVRGKNKLGESPVWSVREAALYWVDSREPAVYRLRPATGELRSVPVPCIVGSIALRGSGGLIAALQTGFHGLDFERGTLSPIVDPEAGRPENRFNDGRSDRQGRIWSGTMNDTRRDPDGSLYRLDPDHTCTKIRDDIIVPNSICWSPDDRTMYFADSYRGQILAYAFDAPSGTLGAATLFADMRANRGRPDGSTVDAEGCVWNAEYGGGRIARFTPGGRVDRIVELPVTQTTSCSFGGPGLDVLYVTSATQRMTPEELAAQPLAGSLFALDPGVRGLPEPEYAG
jgi:sugar lactone lactonase YvrE